MSCRRISRELLERFRFGEELDQRSAPHLAHLEVCATCRGEVGLDRALVRQLQRALRARVEGQEPSPRAFNAVRIRALAAEDPVPWSGRLLRWTRLAPAGVVTAVMLAAAIGAAQGQQATELAERTIAWPGFLERVDPGPPTPHESAWWLQYQPRPAITQPASGLIASIDPSKLGKTAPLPKPNTGLIE